MLVAVRGLLLHPTRKMLPASIVERGFCWVPNGLLATTRRNVIQTTKLAFCPYSTQRSPPGLPCFASQSESIPLDVVDTEEIDMEGEMDDLDMEEGFTINLPKGTLEGFYVVKTFKTSSEQFDMNQIRTVVDGDDIERLELTSQNISVPVALMMVDSNEYPSRSRARKACRKANIIIHRGPLGIDNETGEEVFDSTKCIRARVGDRLFPGGRFGTDFPLECSRFSYNPFNRRLREANTDGRGIFSCHESQKAPF
jgi:hypothetical protein